MNKFDQGKLEKRFAQEERDKCDARRSEMSPGRRATIQIAHDISEDLKALTVEALDGFGNDRRRELMAELQRLRSHVHAIRQRMKI